MYRGHGLGHEEIDSGKRDQCFEILECQCSESAPAGAIPSSMSEFFVSGWERRSDWWSARAVE